MKECMCSCGKGIAYAAAAEEQAEMAHADAHIPGWRSRRHRLEAVPDLARSYVAQGYVQICADDNVLEKHYALLRGAFRAPPGIVNRELIDAVDVADSGIKFDMQYETVGGQLKDFMPLQDLKDKRDESAGAPAKGYQRPSRKHRSMAHQCRMHHARLDFYGKSWIRGSDPQGVPNVEKRAYALEMDHMLPQHYQLGNDLKEVFWSELNDASKHATYNSVICMLSKNMEHVEWHSDTLVSERDYSECPYVPGAAILVVMTGMRQMLHTRGLRTGPYAKPKLYDFPTTGVPCIELEDGCAYMIPAGEVGSVDYLVEHMTYAHPLGPGEEWAGVEQPERKAWVYRAVKPSHAQWYSQHWPHQMCPPSHAELLYGESQREKVWG